MSERPVQGTPYGDLWWGLWDNYTDAEKHVIINRFKAAYAHELAEQIRQYAETDGGHTTYDGIQEAADLIDPETKEQN